MTGLMTVHLYIIFIRVQSTVLLGSTSTVHRVFSISIFEEKNLSKGKILCSQLAMTHDIPFPTLIL